MHIKLSLVHFNSFGVIRFQSLKLSKSYHNNQVTSIELLLKVPISFSLYYELM